MSTDPIYVPPPNVGPEPPGLMQAVREKIFGASPAPQPDPYAITPEQAVALLTETRGFCDTGRELFEQGWWRNLLYFLNRQWIFWNPTARTWQDKRLARWIPKPVTNIIRTTVLSIRATFADIRLSTMAKPNGNAPLNLLTAQTADDLEPMIQREHDIKHVFSEADFWAIVTGNVFLHPHWDQHDRTHVKTVQIEECQLCHAQSEADAIVRAGQKCPQCGSSALQPAGTRDEVLGKGRTLAVSSLELLLPIYAQSFEHVDRLVHLLWRPKHELEAELPPDVFARIAWDTGPQQRSLQLYKALGTTSDITTSQGQLGMAGTVGNVPGATEQRLWIRPCAKYPKGFYMRYIGDAAPIPLMDRPVPDLPYKNNKGEPLWVWIHYQYESVGGRLYGSSAVDSIIEKQDQLNKIDSMTQMVAQRMGNPVWLEPKGAEVERFTGDAGLIVRWQPVGASSAKPERVGGENPPQSFFAMREQYKADAEELAGTYDVLKGAKPSGVEAFSALQLLVDRSQSRFKSPFESRSEAYRQWYTLALELERTYGPPERVGAVLGPNKSWTFQTFQKADLDGDITITVEDGANMPKTALGRRAAIEHAKQLQLLSPDNNEQNYQILMELGLPELMPSLDSDVKSALQEQQAFEEWFAKGGPRSGTPSPLVRMPWHNDVLHLQENRKWMNSDAVREMLATFPPGSPEQIALVQTLGQHLQSHADAMVAAQAAAPPPATGPAGPAGPPKPGEPSKPQGQAGAMKSSNDQGSHPNPPPTH